MSILFIIFVYLHHVLSLIFQNAMKFANYVLPVAILLTSYTAAWAQPQSFIEFNGTDQYVEIPSHSDFDITADKSFSITCWVSVDDLINGQRFVSRRVMGESSQTTGYEMWGGGSSSQYYAVNTPIPGGAISSPTGVEQEVEQLVPGCTCYGYRPLHQHGDPLS